MPVRQVKLPMMCPRRKSFRNWRNSSPIFSLKMAFSSAVNVVSSPSETDSYGVPEADFPKMMNTKMERRKEVRFA